MEMCDACYAALPWLVPPLCVRCGEDFMVPIPEDARQFDDRTCARCRKSSPAYSFARSALKYEGVARAAVRALKFGGRKALGGSLADLMEKSMRRFPELAAGVQEVVPVPLHAKREQERGYNQSAVLARNLAERLGLPYADGAVARLRQTPPQVGLDRLARKRNMEGAFEVTDVPRVEGKVILLVDDVMTTGATVSACAAALKAAGAGEVRVVTLARG